jgi:hypothetical protein
VRTLLTKTLIALAVLACTWTSARAGFGVRVGIGIGVPYPYYYGPYYRPYYGYYPYYYPPAVVVAAPAPAVVVQPAPAVVQPAPSGYQSVPASPPPPTLPAPTPISAAPALQVNQPAPLAPVVARSAAPDERPGDVDRLFQLLNDPGEGARISAAMQLGRGKVQQAIGPLTQMLNNDASPRVRDAAARALGLIASPSSLNALQTAAQADDDKEVRHSAQFAAEVIRSNLRR